jgi:transketolase
MEGISHEAASLAGHLGLGKLIALYDDNHITIEGETELTYSDQVSERFQSYGWHVLDIGDNANNLPMIADAIQASQKVNEKPSLIIVRSHIGFGSPNMQDTPEAHGAPLGEEEIKLTKKAYGWPEEEKFLVPGEVREHMGGVIQKGAELEKEWAKKLSDYKSRYPDLASQFENAIKGELPAGWDSEVPQFRPEDGSQATRNVSGKVLNAIAAKVPALMGGSADLAPSTKTLIKGTGYFSAQDYAHRNIAWGIREFGMCACSSGMALHGGLRPFMSTFFVFTDYARPAIRLAALMKLPLIYVMTHDSIGVGEDGPTHQPVEHLASFRILPNLCVIRPADANETSHAWRVAMTRRSGPTMLVLTRQGLPVLDQGRLGNAEGVARGAYLLSKEKGKRPDLLLLASGSEVHLVLEAQQKLAQEGVDARVVSMASFELFKEQAGDYRDQILPPDVKARLAVEAGVATGWHEWVGEAGDVVSVDDFGASAPAKVVFKNYGFSLENIVEKAKALL